MKRDPFKSDISIRATYPLLFWKPCAICGQEFRREKGYFVTTPNLGAKIMRNPSLLQLGAPFYVCGDHSPEVINDYCKERMMPKTVLVKEPS